MTGPISNHFTWHEATYLPQWGREADELDGLDDTIKANLEALFRQMDKVRDYFNKPIVVHVTYRPDAYNKLVKGAIHSAHLQGMACDFNIEGVDCDEARKTIVDNNLLETWNMRMENLPGANWVHLDIAAVPPGGHRFFKP